MTKSKPDAQVMTVSEAMADYAHRLTHELDVDAVLVLTFRRGAEGVRASFRIACPVPEDDHEGIAQIAQGIRQGCANISKLLRERFVERTTTGDVRTELGPFVSADDAIDGETAVGGDAKKVH